MLIHGYAKVTCECHDVFEAFVVSSMGAYSVKATSVTPTKEPTVPLVIVIIVWDRYSSVQVPKHGS